MERFRNPKKAPTKVKGTDTPNHKANKATKVKNGIAAEEASYHNTKFMMKKCAKTILESSKQNYIYTYINQ